LGETMRSCNAGEPLRPTEIAAPHRWMRAAPVHW
jgi:hypothetical protein